MRLRSLSNLAVACGNMLVALLTIVILLGRKIPFRRIRLGISTPFRPVHLQSLNPRSPL